MTLSLSFNLNDNTTPPPTWFAPLVESVLAPLFAVPQLSSLEVAINVGPPITPTQQAALQGLLTKINSLDASVVAVTH